MLAVLFVREDERVGGLDFAGESVPVIWVVGFKGEDMLLLVPVLVPVELSVPPKPISKTPE
jgi:hypothetical protein